MALERIHLRELLKILFLEPNKCQSELRKDIREELVKESGNDVSGGGDFYGPFWADAKDHVFGRVDLRDMVDERVASNWRRKDLYPQLRDGFLLWWNQRRRWTNTPFSLGRSIKTQFQFPGIEAVVKVDNILSVMDGLDVERAIYPYFSPEPVLSEEAARWGLWLLTTALPNIPATEFRILDVIRGRTFSLDRTPLRGNEEDLFRRRYLEVIRLRDRLRSEY